MVVKNKTNPKEIVKIMGSIKGEFSSFTIIVVDKSVTQPET
jgi:hypothetical protein